MRVMFTGTHGIGKSTSAMKLNSVLPAYLYVPSFAGAVAKRMGFDINRSYSAEQLLAYQDRVLTTFIESFKATSLLPTIYDRSPNDIAAYLVTGMKALGKYNEYAFQVHSFEKRCLAATKSYCDLLIYPEADFTEKMQLKYNRPIGDAYNRQEFDKLIDYYCHEIQHEVKVIDVPVQYQYNDRINFILEKMNRDVRV